MIHSLLLGLIFLVISPCYGWEYKLDKDSLLKPSVIDLYEISSHFKSHGYFSISDTSLIQTGLPFDNAYIGPGMGQNLVIKAGLGVPDKYEGITLYEPQLDVYVFHFKLRDVPYMVMGLNFTEREFKEVVSPWMKIKKTSLMNLIIPSAYAETCEIPGNPTKELEAASRSLSGEAILKKIGECGMEALKGVGDQISNTFDFFKKLATNPKQLWQETKEAFNEVKSFVLNINTELKIIFANLGTLSLPDQLDIACHLSGHAFAMIAQSFLIGPTALARSVPMVVNKLRKLSEQISNASILRKKGVKLPDNKKLVNEVTRCE